LDPPELKRTPAWCYSPNMRKRLVPGGRRPSCFPLLTSLSHIPQGYQGRTPGRSPWLLALAAVLGVCLWAQTGVPEKVDLAVLHRIKTEAFAGRSKVMDTAFYLTDVYGPRLTGSPSAKQAGDWAVKTLSDWGLANVHMEQWAFAGAGWSCSRFVAMMEEPEFQPIIGFAQPWSLGTNGAVTGEAVLAVISSAADLDQYKGKLKGKIVLTATPHASEMVVAPYTHRLTDAELAAAEESPDPISGNPAALPLGFPSRTPVAGAAGRGGAGGRGAAGAFGAAGRGGLNNLRAQLNKFYKDEGALVLLSPGNGPDGGTVVGQGTQSTEDNAPIASVVVTNEHYNRIVRLLEKNIPVKLEFDIRTKFTPPGDSFNIVADLPGANPNSGMVMLGGHFDSWTGGTGATDNAAGAAVAMEVIRVLKALDLQMARTVRLALWTGEEQGSLGSRAYVREHVQGTDGPGPDQAKISAYYNLDNGSGKIRGIYMQDNDAVRPIFEAWVAPLKDLGADALTIRATGSTDHTNFDNAGVPGFQFIQDPLEYAPRTHHSNMDVYDRLQVNDLEQASAVMAWFVYNTASRPEMLPRKFLAAGRGGGGGGRRGGQ
jgi:carboxypeptidase Q